MNRRRLLLADVIDAFEARYHPTWAEPWDAVGLVCGEPDASVRKVLFAIDPVASVVDEAEEWGADLLLVHHPLLLRPVHGVPATNPKGRLVHRLISRGIGLYVAHTNADVANPGVSDALAETIGIVVTAPLDPSGDDLSGRRGLGRMGHLPEPSTLRAFTAAVADGLPGTAGGLRVAGDPEQRIHTVAVCGGAGDSLLDQAREAGADVFVTADLRHHPSSEAREHGSMALVDAGHWATEWPWLSAAATRLAGDVGRCGDTVKAPLETRVSTQPTDAWTYLQPPRY